MVGAGWDMNDSSDLRWLLEQWPYDPSQTVRLTRGGDGRQILQVRLPLGLEQYELEGRPDGQRPRGCDSFLDFHLHRLAGAKARGEAAQFRVTAAECEDLFNEGTLYYFRYLQCFQLKDWRRTVRDTERNLRLFDFAHEYAQREEDRLHLEPWRPYVLRLHATAQAMIQLEKNRYADALKSAVHAIDAIEALPDLEGEVFAAERDRALTSLRELAAQIRQHQPLSRRQRLERELRQAIEAQAFEEAARLRDEIRSLQESETPEADH